MKICLACLWDHIKNCICQAGWVGQVLIIEGIEHHANLTLWGTTEGHEQENNVSKSLVVPGPLDHDSKVVALFIVTLHLTSSSRQLAIL